MEIFAPKHRDKLGWYAVSEQTGEVHGPFDPGAVWFEAPAALCSADRLKLATVTDLLLSEAHAGWERLQRTLAFLQPHGTAVWRRFQEFGIVPEQTPALTGRSGGVDIRAYIGDGGAGFGITR